MGIKDRVSYLLNYKKDRRDRKILEKKFRGYLREEDKKYEEVYKNMTLEELNEEIRKIRSNGIMSFKFDGIEYHCKLPIYFDRELALANIKVLKYSSLTDIVLGKKITKCTDKELDAYVSSTTKGGRLIDLAKEERLSKTRKDGVKWEKCACETCKKGITCNKSLKFKKRHM